MPNPIVELVEKEMAAFRELRLAHPQLFPANDRLYPIPFFGDIRRAEVLTIALSPSQREFDPHRQWPDGQGPGSLTPTALTNRLLGYFHLAQVPPADLFRCGKDALAVLGYSYELNSAHLDIHPFPSKFANEMNPEQKAKLRGIITERSSHHLASVLSLCERVKLIIVIEFALPGSPNLTTFRYIRDALAPQLGILDSAGTVPPLIDGLGRDRIAHRLEELRPTLKPFLSNAPRLLFTHPETR